MKANIVSFINELIFYDYILFGTVFTLFILMLVLAIILRHNTALTVTLVILSFAVLGGGSTLGYIKMHQYLYDNSTSILEQKKLTYTKAVVLYGAVKNISKFDFKSCKITASAYKVSGNPIKDYIYKFKPFVKMSSYEYDILRGQEREFKLIVEPFTHTKDYNLTLEASCK